MRSTAIQEHALSNCRQDDGTYKKSHATQDAAESWERVTRERYGNDEQRAYECDLRGSVNQAHWHLTRLTGRLEDRTSAPYAQPSLPILPTYSDEDDVRKRGRQPGSTLLHVESRRVKVLNALKANPGSTYPQIAAGLGIDINLFRSDVAALQSSGRYEGRYQGRVSDPRPYRSTPPQTAAEKLAELDKQRAELLVQIKADEAARIERERVRYTWITHPTGDEVMQVEKNGQLFVTTFEGWEEVCKVVTEALLKKRKPANATI